MLVFLGEGMPTVEEGSKQQVHQHVAEFVLVFIRRSGEFSFQIPVGDIVSDSIYL